MGKIISNYSEYVCDEKEYGLNIPNSKETNFFQKTGWCPFCKKEINKIVSESDTTVEKWGPWHEMSCSIWQCDCGWWQIEARSYMQEENNYKDWWEKRINAQLQSYFVNDKNIPIEVLREYIFKNQDDIILINDKKMEELVASVFKDFYDCEVHVVGKSGDGGVDLVLINGNNPCIIQVKRRTKLNATESVKEVRDLIGTTVLKQAKQCAFVTTADHFSKDALNSRNRSIEIGIVDSFELFNFQALG